MRRKRGENTQSISYFVLSLLSYLFSLIFGLRQRNSIIANNTHEPIWIKENRAQEKSCSKCLDLFEKRVKRETRNRAKEKERRKK